MEPASRFVEQKWEAQWIAPPNAPPREYGVYHFRKTIELPERPERFVVNVSADNRYTLYVNGQVASFGPERGDLRHWRFDTVDLAPLLKAGENLIAAQVWNFGIEAPVAQVSEQTGFILQGEGEISAQANTDASWRVLSNAAYRPITGFGKKLDTYIVVGPGDDVDATRYPWGWKAPEFDDSEWPLASELRAGQPRGTSTDGKWLLVPRSIPAMELSPIRWQRVRRSENVDVPHGFLAGNAPLTVPPQTVSRILLDQDQLATAFPELQVSGGRGSKITLTYAESLYEGAIEEMSRVKGDRDAIEGKHIRGFQDIFRPDGGDDRIFIPLQWRTYRYVEVAIETGEEPLEINDMRATFTAYPLVEHATFESSDPNLEKIWDIAWRTMRTGTHEIFTDSPYYEQLSYVGDTRLEAITALYVSGDDRLMRKSIKSFDHSRNANGLTSSRYPDSRHQLIPPYSLFWIGMTHDYWRLRDDPEFVRSTLPGVREVLRYFAEHSDPDTGSYIGRKWWNFVDWIPQWGRDPVVGLGGVPPRDDNGISAILDLQHVRALQQARDLHAALGEREHAERYDDLARRIRNSVIARCWDDERGLLADTPDKDTFSQHTNAFFILTAEQEARTLKAVARRMVDDDDLVEATLYFSYYVHRALIEAGLGDSYIEQLGPWRHVLEQGLTTLPETPKEDSRSDSHAWGSHPVYHMLSNICGIQALEPGFKAVRIAPSLGPLEFARGSVPHPLGTIEVDFKREADGGISGQIVLPEGLGGIFVWGEEAIELRPGSQSVSL